MQNNIQTIIDEVETYIKGKDTQVKLALAAFLSGGHILIEDLPGVGKTSLAKVFARVLGLDYARIQFTSDMLPSDILGINYFDARNASFEFRPGPVFSQFLLADEINRATPKTQSALLEAMEEHQVSIDGKTMALPEPFFVMATKNPFEEIGTFELPGSQLDRFMISFSLGYPHKEAEKAILSNTGSFELDRVNAVAPEIIPEARKAVAAIHLSDAILEYMHELLHFTRHSALYTHGLSTRGAIALSKMSRAWAFIQQRDFVIPSDVAFVLPYIVGHRLLPKDKRLLPHEIADEILSHLHPDA